jgi:hypothetical protein
MKPISLVAPLMMLTAGAALAADPATIDWNALPDTTVTLFYPGQSSYEWLRKGEHGKGKGAKAV